VMSVLIVILARGESEKLQRNTPDLPAAGARAGVDTRGSDDQTHAGHDAGP
jgi:hypothetical protein